MGSIHAKRSRQITSNFLKVYHMHENCTLCLPRPTSNGYKKRKLGSMLDSVSLNELLHVCYLIKKLLQLIFETIFSNNEANNLAKFVKVDVTRAALLCFPVCAHVLAQCVCVCVCVSFSFNRNILFTCSLVCWARVGCAIGRERANASDASIPRSPQHVAHLTFQNLKNKFLSWKMGDCAPKHWYLVLWRQADKLLLNDMKLTIESCNWLTNAYFFSGSFTESSYGWVSSLRNNFAGAVSFLIAKLAFVVFGVAIKWYVQFVFIPTQFHQLFVCINQLKNMTAECESVNLLLKCGNNKF